MLIANEARNRNNLCQGDSQRYTNATSTTGMGVGLRAIAIASSMEEMAIFCLSSNTNEARVSKATSESNCPQAMVK